MRRSRGEMPGALARRVIACCAALCVALPVASASAALPDGRAYELVTPQENYGSEVYQPEAPGVEYSGEQTELHFQAAANGNRIAYVAAPTIGGDESQGSNAGNEYLGTRLPDGGWKQTNITPEDPGVTLNREEARQMLYEDFSSDLSTGILESIAPLASTAPGYGEALPEFGGLYDVLYSTPTEGGGVYTPLFTVKPPYRSHGAFQTVGGVGPYRRLHLVLAGASSDMSHTLFAANDALTGASEGRPAAEGGTEAAFANENNLYEGTDGQLRLVNVLPDGTTHANAEFGNGPGRSEERVISEDGSRIFWTDLATGHIYVRENGTSTVEISPAGKYQTASSDGSLVFYTNGDLYEYELAGAKTTDLTPGVPVETVIGTSADGKYVYFLTAGDELELWHEGVTTPIAHTEKIVTGEVAASGRGIVYTEANYYFESTGLLDVHVFSADTGSLYCLECTAGGTHAALPNTSGWRAYETRWISEDGSRVFFDSVAGLVPGDANGQMDVYEWERPGTNGCAQSEGCIYLLSGGISTDASYLADASASGDDVFIITRAALVGEDQNDLYDMYDARVGGGPPPTPPECTGSGCQGVPNAPPIFATPSSVTFAGVGDFAAGEATTKAKPKPKNKAKAKKKARHKAKAKHRRKARRRAKARRRGKAGRWTGGKSTKASKSAGRAARRRSGAKGGRS